MKFMFSYKSWHQIYLMIASHNIGLLTFEIIMSTQYARL